MYTATSGVKNGRSTSTKRTAERSLPRPSCHTPSNFPTPRPLFSFFARQDGNDSAYVRAVTPRYSSAKRKYAIAADNGTAYPSEYILMETFPEKPYDTSCEIILAAFTTGLVEKVNYGGQQGVRIDYCGLRDTHVDPKTWQEKYKVPRFIYFSLKLED